MTPPRGRRWDVWFWGPSDPDHVCVVTGGAIPGPVWFAGPVWFWTRNDIKLFGGYWLIWLCCIIGFLVLIIKSFDNQTDILFRLQNVCSQIKQDRLRPLSKTISQPPSSPPSSYQPPDTVDYLRFLYVSSSLVKTSFVITSRQRRIYWCLQCDFQGLSMVHFLRVSCCFGHPWNCLHILTTSGYVWLTWACPHRHPDQ